MACCSNYTNNLLPKQATIKPPRGVYVKDLMQFVVKGVPEITSVLQVGKKNRVVGATMMNQVGRGRHAPISIAGSNAFMTPTLTPACPSTSTHRRRPPRAHACMRKPQDSSRSHSIFTITIETTERFAAGQQAAAAEGHIRVGKLNLVDLAGSERQSKTGATGAGLTGCMRLTRIDSSCCITETRQKTVHD